MFSLLLTKTELPKYLLMELALSYLIYYEDQVTRVTTVDQIVRNIETYHGLKKGERKIKPDIHWSKHC